MNHLYQSYVWAKEYPNIRFIVGSPIAAERRIDENGRHPVYVKADSYDMLPSNLEITGRSVEDWFEIPSFSGKWKVVFCFKRKCNGEALIIRYVDDFICAFQYQQDAELFYQQLNERLEKFGLEVCPEKTRVLPFSRNMLKQSETFEFLGFEFRRTISRKFKPIIRRRTFRKKPRASIAAFTEWIKTNRNKKISKTMTILRAKYRGYWNYYGVIGN